MWSGRAAADRIEFWCAATKEGSMARDEQNTVAREDQTYGDNTVSSS